MTNPSTCSEISEEAIAQRAYEIWQQRGCPDGDGKDNWETALAQLRQESESTAPKRRPFMRLLAHLRGRAAC